MTPCDRVLSQYKLPFDLFPFQAEGVNELAPLNSNALYWEPGLGKTAGSTVIALYKLMAGTDTVLIIVPPLLIKQWGHWLSKIVDVSEITLYHGPPAKRHGLSFDVTFIVMGIQIFKKEYHAISLKLEGRKVHVILDEAQCIKDVSTGNHEKYSEFVADKSHTLLTGTPLNVPIDGYAYIKLVSPGVYRNLYHFEETHVESVDLFKRPDEYKNLDLLKANLLLGASRKTKDDVLNLPPCTIQTIDYELAPSHYALYRTMVEEQLLLFDDGEKIDMTTVMKLYHALGQVVLQWGYFARNDKLKAAGMELVEQVVDELCGKKLIIFSNYIKTNEEVVRRFGCPGIWSGTSEKERQGALREFIDNPKCNLIALSPRAAGVGVDGLQTVCCEALYLEPPIAVSHFGQSLSRIDRQGQTKPVTIRLGVAIGTIQEYLVSQLTDKEALVNPLQGSKAELRDALYGRKKSTRWR
jgi:SNF2 family DNA or RNA helicase